jgi:hypothetical protein
VTRRFPDSTRGDRGMNYGLGRTLAAYRLIMTIICSYFSLRRHPSDAPSRGAGRPALTPSDGRTDHSWDLEIYGRIRSLYKNWTCTPFGRFGRFGRSIPGSPLSYSLLSLNQCCRADANQSIERVGESGEGKTDTGGIGENDRPNRPNRPTPRLAHGSRGFPRNKIVKPIRMR